MTRFGVILAQCNQSLNADRIMLETPMLEQK